MSQLKAEFVKTGYWVNLAKGPVMGATITTPTTTGNLVTALLAVLTTFGTSHLWNLLNFAYYQFHLHHRPADGLYWQQQALLRTLPTPATLVSEWLKLWWSWRNRANKALQRLLLPVAISLIFAAATVAAGIFSSYIVDGRNIEILVHSQSCGPIDLQVSNDESTYNTNYYHEILDLGYTYAKDCYTGNNRPERCKIFVQPTVPLRQERVECPFGTKLCKNITLPALVLDSDFVDLNSFGLNLRPKERVRYRKRTTCAVLELQDHSEIVDASSLKDFEYVYGRKTHKLSNFLLLQLGESALAFTNYTMLTSLLREQFSDGLSLQIVMYYHSPSYVAWNTLKRPLPEMENSADLIILSIRMGKTSYLQPVDDIMFSAHKVSHQATGVGVNTTYYKPDFPLSAVGCQLQYQFCYAHEEGRDVCTPLEGLPTSENLSQKHPGASSIQLAIIENLVTLSLLFDTGTLREHFRAADEVGGVVAATAIRKEYWIEEILFWEQYVWSQLQIAFTKNAIGSATMDPAGPVARATNGTTEGQKQLCGKQKMRSPGGFVNINVFGLAFTIAACCLVTVIDIVILRFLIYLKAFRKALSPRIKRWIDDGIFQTQRKAFEAHGAGIWECLDEVVPVTITKTELSWGPGPCKCMSDQGSSSSRRPSIATTATGGTDNNSPGDHNSPGDNDSPGDSNLPGDNNSPLDSTKTAQK